MKSQNFTFLKIIRGKSELSTDYSEESFSIPQKVTSLSSLLKLILDKNSTMGDQYYSRVVRTMKTYGVNYSKINFLRLSAESQIS